MESYSVEIKARMKAAVKGIEHRAIGSGTFE